MHLKFPSAKSIIVSGDIHGDFNQLIFKLCVQYQLRDTLLVVVGDCVFGFENPSYFIRAGIVTSVESCFQCLM